MKIFFLQPAYAHYRNKFFELLSNHYNIIYFFERSKRTYPGQTNMPNISHCFLDLQFKFSSIGILYYLLKEKPEIVITSVSSSFRSLISQLYTQIFNKRLILWVEEWTTISTNSSGQNATSKIKIKIRSIVSEMVIKYSSAIVTSGTASYNYIRSKGVDKNKIFISIQSTPDLGKHIGLKESINNSSKYVFLYIGRIIELKGLDILLKAYHQLRRKRNDISLFIAGDGPFKEYCMQLSRKLDIDDVTFYGSISHDRVSDIYKQGDVFVLPSYFFKNNYEGWGLVINEAMSMGLPIITTNAVGASFDLVVNGANGYIVKENSVDDLYRAMEKILEMNLIEMGKCSRVFFENNNDYNKMTAGFIRAIKYVINI